MAILRIILCFFVVFFGCIKQTTNLMEVTPSEALFINYKNKFVETGLPIICDELTSVDKRFDMVIDYGKYLKENLNRNVDSITIHSDLYWKAFIAMSTGNPTVYHSIIFLLIKEGLLDHAMYVHTLSLYHTDFNNEDNKFVYNRIVSGYSKIYEESNKFMKYGIQLYDKGKIEEAIDMYNKALIIYPNNPWAYYEIGLSKIMEFLASGLKETSENESKEDYLEGISNAPHQTYYSLVKKYDPFCKLAYQGNKEQSKYGLPVVKKINPALEVLRSGKADVETFISFAEGCEEMKQFEYAAYGYYQAVLKLYNKKFDMNYAKKFAECLRHLGCNDAAEFYLTQVNAFNE